MRGLVGVLVGAFCGEGGIIGLKLIVEGGELGLRGVRKKFDREDSG